MAKAEQPDIREELRILTTQIETINQQLSSNSGGGSDPALANQMRQMEQKINYLYDMMKGLQAEVTESVQTYFNQVASQVTKALNSNLTQVFSKLDALEKAGLKSGGTSSGSKDIVEMKSSLKELIDVYKDEVQVFKEQNDYLQKKLLDIEKKLDKK